MNTPPADHPRIDAVLLDLGNVLINVDFAHVFAYWSKRSGREVSLLHGTWTMDEAYRRHEVGSLDFAGYVATLRERLGIEMPMDHWIAGWNAVFTGPVAGVAERLERLSKQVPLFGFTNTNPTHHAFWAQHYAELLKPLSGIYVSSAIGLRKPAVAAFEHVASEVGTEPGSILFLDDTLENIEGARAAGLQAVWVRNGEEVLAALDAASQQLDRARS